MRRGAWAASVLTVLFVALPGNAEEPRLPSVDLGVQEHDAGHAHGPGAPAVAPRTPFDCLFTTTPSALKIRGHFSGDHGSSRLSLDLELWPDGASLSGEDIGRHGAVSVRSRRLTRSEGRRILAALVDAATRQEGPGCDSSLVNDHETVIEWSCSGREMGPRKVAFSGTWCWHPNPEPAPRSAAQAGTFVFTRAVDVQLAAKRVLEEASR